jgi:uncharacterized protein (UPF0333 family)
MLKRTKFTKPGKTKKGQSTVEYIILVAAILAALIIFLQPNGIFSSAVNETFTSGTNGMQDMANRLASSRPTAP